MYNNMASIRQELIDEHELIERDLIELETIMNTSIINFPNLIHVLKKLKDFFNRHEQKEEKFFGELSKKGFTIPVKKIDFEHGRLKKDMDMLINVINSGSENETHTVLYRNGKDLINNLRKHMNDEDWILYALPKKF
jgi:DUF438 domain-containing protein